MNTITLPSTVTQAREMDVVVTDDRHPLEIELSQFIGTTQYHVWSILFRHHVLTDGALHLAEEAGAYWLMDLIASHFTKRKVRRERFQVWRLRKLGDNCANDAIVKADDGNGNHISQQLIPYTDFPLDEIKLYVVWNGSQWVIMLPSEY